LTVKIVNVNANIELDSVPVLQNQQNLPTAILQMTQGMTSGHTQAHHLTMTLPRRDWDEWKNWGKWSDQSNQ
jgi:hypothetical protein